jgi:ribosome maturation factor RimP
VALSATFFRESSRSRQQEAQQVSATETQLEAVRAAVEPAVAALGCDLYDVEFAGSGSARTLRVTVTKQAGLDLDAITEITQTVSPLVDDLPINGSFVLEVSSPGIERTLRRPEHYAGAIGDLVSVKFHTEAGPRRVRGTLQFVDADRVVVESEDDSTEVEIALPAVTQARTVFEWGPQPRPKSSGKTRARAKGKV